jgi:hypothetical protein
MNNLKPLKVVLLATFISFIINLYSQEKQDYNWLFANRSSGHNGYTVSTILDFNHKSVSFINDTAQFTLNQNNASVSDNDGKLLFYTNGCEIIQANHDLMENGDSINFGKFSKDAWGDCKNGYNGFQDIIILNDPKNNLGYYVIHKIWDYNSQKIFIKDIRHTYVDMVANQGLGKVLYKNIPFYTSTELTSSYLTAIRHQNGKDWWFIQMDEKDNTYHKFVLSDRGILLNNTQRYGSVPSQDTSRSGWGTAKFSPDGKKWAWYTVAYGLYLFDFDRSVGQLSNLKQYKLPHRTAAGSVEFSPNSRFVYVTLTDTLMQIDTWKENLYDGAIFIDKYDGFQDPFSANFHIMNLAPDCKIYMSSTNSTKSLSVINYPNKKGKDCNFVQHQAKLFYTRGIDMPNFPRLRVDEEDLCDSIELYTDVIDLSLQKANLKLYPNPVVDIAKVEAEANGLLYVYDIRGQQIKKQVVHQGDNYLDMEAYISGVYFVRFVDVNGREYRGKIVKVNYD